MARRPSQSPWVRAVAIAAILSMVLLTVAALVASIGAAAA